MGFKIGTDPSIIDKAKEKAGEDQDGENAKRERKTRGFGDVPYHRRAHEAAEKTHRTDERYRRGGGH